MIKTAESVSLGHPDKIADYISSYILDRFLEQDENVRYAVEVMIKDNTVVLGGEVCGHVASDRISDYVRTALFEIGYTSRYSKRWGGCALNPAKLQIINLIGCQSEEIYRGVARGGWGDQGVFAGYAVQGKGALNTELYTARLLNKALYQVALESDNLGLDIKTQVTLDDNADLQTVIVAIPMLKEEDIKPLICRILDQEPPRLIINGTGKYTVHSSIADSGITGRKLASDFYGLACPVGGGSPWGKDAGKADVSLNILARRLAVGHLSEGDEAFVYLSSCIGRSDLPSAVLKIIKNGRVFWRTLQGDFSPKKVISDLGLTKPVFAQLCRDGLTALPDPQ